MKNCIFCQIANGKRDENYRIFYSDNQCYAMFVNNPETYGHFILVTKKHFSQVSEFGNMKNYFAKGIMLAEENVGKLKTVAYTLKFNNNVYLVEDDNGHVGHIHIHIVPKYKHDKQNNPKTNDNYFKNLKALFNAE